MGIFNSKELKQLRDENEALKVRFQQAHLKEENLKNLDQVLKKMRMEVARLNDEKMEIKESIKKIVDEEKQKQGELDELNNKIEHLNSLKSELQAEIMRLTAQSDELRQTPEYNQYYSEPIEEALLQDSPEKLRLEEIVSREAEITHSISEANDKLDSLSQEESDLQNIRIERLQEIQNLELKAKEYLQTLSEIEQKINVGNERVRILKEEERSLQKSLEKKQLEISSFEAQMKQLEEQYSQSEQKLAALKQDETNLISTIDTLKDDEQALTSKLEMLKKLDSSNPVQVMDISQELSQRDEIKRVIEEEERKLMDELNEKKKLVNEAEEEYQHIVSELKIRKKELFDTEQTLNIKAQRLSAINLELLQLEKKNSSLRSEMVELESARNNIYLEIQREKEIANKLTAQHKKILELVPLLEKRKLELESGNAELEERFSRMFQKFSRDLDEINRKRSVLEQIVVQKERDAEEKDRLLLEKMAALEESEKVLSARQEEIASFEHHLEGIKDQREIYIADLAKLEQESNDRKNTNHEIRLETDALYKKKTSLENSLQDLLGLMNESYGRSKERNQKFESELNYYEDQLQGFRSKLSDSMKELEALRVSSTTLKVQEEESKGNVDKLKVMKSKLLEEIARNQQVLQRYERVRDKEKVEPSEAKNFEEVPPKANVSQSDLRGTAEIFRLQ